MEGGETEPPGREQEGRAARHALTGEVQDLGERHLQALLDRPVRVLARDIAQAARQEEVDALVGEARARPGRAQLLPAAGLPAALLAQLAASGPPRRLAPLPPARPRPPPAAPHG